MLYINIPVKFLTFIVVSSIFLIGCDNLRDTSSTPESSVPKMDGMITFGTPPSAKVSKPSLDVLSDQLMSFRSAAKSAATMRKAHRKIRELLADSSSAPRTFREQLAAFAMFSIRFQDLEFKSLSNEKLKILGFYTKLLVENRSPEATFVLPALKALRGHWSDQKVAKAARTVAQAARSTYGDSGSSEPRSFQKLKKETGQLSHADKTLEAANQLAQLRISLKGSVH